MVFKVINIKNGTFYLKGVEERLYADSPMEDLNPYSEENKEQEELEEVKSLTLSAMELNQPLKVPLKVDCAFGKTWLEK